MNDELIKDKLNTHERRLNDHSGRLDRLEQRGASVDVKIDNLCQQLSSLTTTLRWFIGLIIGGFATFFFYGIQHNLFK
ncbi:hemolysin XhlA family protein [Clostridium sp. JN-9]|uniref:hemolysin XhlA family protein n=1 Tax=Clostridium sp. JN-9 TaxID=2507159 RepID=UPI000FFE1D57|nr:hemolysin XhlA family protein [Clostridium sp. JN-9]QAT40817.1 hypothetical protein EQM05_11405 [Clostridium sp. JN-9]